MINKFFDRSVKNKEPLQRSPKEITVRVVCSDDRPNLKSLDAEDMRKQYEAEENGTLVKSYNILRCGVVGALAGFLMALLMFHFGVSLSSNEISFLIGIPAFLGAFTGWAIF